MSTFLLKRPFIVNEGTTKIADVLIKNGRIEKIATEINTGQENVSIVPCEGFYLLPGLIDDQVHFREPGLTSKATIFTESRAAAAGGITSFMDMPNTIPNALTQELLEEKYQIGSQHAHVNYSFYMGASNTNQEEVLKTNTERVCGVKIFMGSSTGNMLVDSEKTLNGIFQNSPSLIAVHCEDEHTIRQNLETAKERYGAAIPPSEHPLIRSAEACYLSSSLAVSLARKHNSRLHVLHISTARELDLFDSTTPLHSKRITAEACIHHLWFSDHDYARLGNRIKWNPAIKTSHDREALIKALNMNILDVIATDHAPHLPEEKDGPYLQAASGGPLVQHALVALLELYHLGKINLETIVEKTSHAVATCFNIKERGFIREGYKADLVLVDLDRPWVVVSENILYKCGWSPFEGQRFHSSVLMTFVNGKPVYSEGELIENRVAERLLFEPGQG